MNKLKSKRGKKRSYRRHNDKARGITSSKPKNKNPFEKLYDLENQQNIMTILEKIVAIKEIDPVNTVVSISSETIRKKPADMSPKELKSVLHLLNVDTRNALEKSELVILLENEFKKTSNSKIDKTFVDTIQKKRQLLMKHLKEEEQRQRVENLKKQKIAEEQRRRDEEHRRVKEEEKRKKHEQEATQKRDEFDKKIREFEEFDRYNKEMEWSREQMENPYYRTTYRSQYPQPSSYSYVPPYPPSSYSHVPPYPPSSYYYQQQQAQRELNEIPIELRYGNKYTDNPSKNFF
jgi:flagellar biosynthesis/type III secretory pathway chaperone